MTLSLPYYPISNTGANDANKVNANLAALRDGIDDIETEFDSHNHYLRNLLDVSVSCTYPTLNNFLVLTSTNNGGVWSTLSKEDVAALLAGSGPHGITTNYLPKAASSTTWANTKIREYISGVNTNLRIGYVDNKYNEVEMYAFGFYSYNDGAFWLHSEQYGGIEAEEDLELVSFSNEIRLIVDDTNPINFYLDGGQLKITLTGINTHYPAGALQIDASGYISSEATGALTATGAIELSNSTRKLIGGAAAISHLDTAGYKHVPTAGATGQFLKYGGSSGLAAWADHGLTYSDVGAAASAHNHNLRDLSDVVTDCLYPTINDFVLIQDTGSGGIWGTVRAADIVGIIGAATSGHNHDLTYYPLTHGVSAGYLARASSTTAFANSAIRDNGSQIGIGGAADASHVVRVYGESVLFDGTHDLNFAMNRTALGDIPAGVLVSTSVTAALTFTPSSGGNSGSILAACAYNGAAWRSMWECANVALGGEPVLTLVKSAGNIVAGADARASDMQLAIRARGANSLLSSLFFATKNGSGTNVGGQIGCYNGGLSMRGDTSALTTPQMLLDSNGCLGIGATPYNSSVKLEVSGASAAAGASIIRLSNTTTTGSSFIALGQTAADGSTPFYIQRYNSAHATRVLGVDIWNGSNGSMRFGTNNTERLVIAADGTVTINNILNLGYTDINISGSTSYSLTVAKSAYRVTAVHSSGTTITPTDGATVGQILTIMNAAATGLIFRSKSSPGYKEYTSLGKELMILQWDGVDWLRERGAP
jgi:hypothetical protein